MSVAVQMTCFMLNGIYIVKEEVQSRCPVGRYAVFYSLTQQNTFFHSLDVGTWNFTLCILGDSMHMFSRVVSSSNSETHGHHVLNASAEACHDAN